MIPDNKGNSKDMLSRSQMGRENKIHYLFISHGHCWSRIDYAITKNKELQHRLHGVVVKYKDDV